MAAESNPGLGSFGAFVAFLLLVVPGLVFEFRRESRRPPHERTAFREASTVALASLGFSAAASGVLAAWSLWQRQWFPSWTGLVQSPSHYTAEHVHLVTRAAVIEVLLACAIALAVDSVLGSKGPGRLSRQEALWLAFHERVSSRLVPYAQVLLDTGVVYRGRVEFIDQTGPDDGRRIVFHRPVLRQAPGEPTDLAPSQRVVLPMARVVEMQLGFPDPGDLD